MIRLQAAVFEPLQNGDLPEVIKALRLALRLEHFTIPPYLYAAYSLKPSKVEIFRIIQSVAIEEMLHMTLVCNVLNALKADPVLADPSVWPTYPNPVPGGLEEDLTVSLAPLSKKQLQTFMQIEQPETPLNFRVAMAAAGEPPRTIGQYYGLIKARILKLDPSAFSSDPRNQIDGDTIPGAVVVNDAKSAIDAIEMIVEQGEGTTQSPLDATGHAEPGEQHDLAHYYKFAELFHGKKLIPNPVAPPGAPPEELEIYNGEPVSFEPEDVYAAPTDPKAADFPADGPVRKAMHECNTTYRDMLVALQAAFTGRPDELDNARGLMTKFGKQARNLFKMNDAGTPAAPTFEYPA